MSSLHCILIVEDNENDLELALEGLSSNNLVNDIHVVNDGAQALDFLYRRGQFKDLENGNPAVILLDLKLPKVGGLEVLKIIKADAALKMIPVVVLTSSNQEQDLLSTYDCGANAYVVKPVDFKKYIDAIQHISIFWALLNEPPPGCVRKRRD